MKKVLYSLFALAAVLASCQREELEVIKPSAPSAHVYRFELTEGETRATLEEDGVFWEAGDQVGLYPGTATSVAANVNTETTPKTVTFTSGTPLEAGTQVYAYYPFQTGNTDATATKIVFPAAQTGGSVSAMPMAGVPFQVRSGDTGTDGVIRFLNLGSVIDFRVYSTNYAGEQIKSIRFAATSGTNPVSGEATIDLTGVTAGDEESLAVSWPENAPVSSSVILTQPATVAATKEAAAENHLYMVVAPGTYSGTITIVTNAATYTFPFTNQTLERNVLKRFNMNLEGNSATQDRNVWYRKITSTQEIVNGGTYLIVYETSGPYAFKPILKSDKKGLVADASNALAVMVENGLIRSTDEVDACQVVLEASGSNYHMKAVGASGYYFYPNSSDIAASQSAANACSITYTGGVVNITKGNNNYFKYSTSSTCFKGSTYDSSRELALYVQEGLSSNVQRLRFSEESVTYLINDQPTPVVFSGTPVLSGYQTEVTYTSSNPSVATVDASTGVVTVYGIGKTVITATAAADGSYSQASASYSLTVWNEPTYSIENDKLAAYLDLVEGQPYNPPADYDDTFMTSELYGGNTNQTNRLDWPKPVPVSWTNPSTGNGAKVVYIYNDAERTQLEFSVNAGSDATSADVYNLIPNRDYYYTVTNGGDVLTTGKFRTVGRRRMIKVAESTYGRAYANNCRDFGGQRTISGKTIKYGKMFRGSNMDKTSAEAKTFLLNYLKIGLDVDLRRSDGSDVAGAGDNKLYDALGLGNEWHTTKSFNSWSDLSSVSNMNEILTKVFSAVKQNKGVYIHCKVGADRTGYVCMLLEAILGVEQGWCDVDYELTSFSGAVDDGKPRCRTGSPVNWYYRRTTWTNQGVDFIYSLSGGSFGTTFQAKAVNYVVNTLGIPLADVQAFQDAMLED